MLIMMAVSHIVSAQDYLQQVALLSEQDGKATFVSAGISDERRGVQTNAAKSVFYTLFYQGVAGINEGKPLVNNDNRLYTNSYFNSAGK